MRSTPEFEQGWSGERILLEWLRKRGWNVLAVCDFTGREANKAPRIHTLSGWLTAPDFLVWSEGCIRWLELKTKTKAVCFRSRREWRHGISERHWKDYLEVERVTNIPGYLAIFEKEVAEDPRCPCLKKETFDDRFSAKLVARFSDLTKVAKKAFSTKAGDVMFPRDSFVHIKDIF